jgi:hypothetical protein
MQLGAFRKVFLRPALLKPDFPDGLSKSDSLGTRHALQSSWRTFFVHRR